MTALDILRERGPMTAAEIARALGVRVESVYEELVPLESRRIVRVNSIFESRNSPPVRTWELM